MSFFLIVRSSDVIRSAVKNAGKFLSYRRQRIRVSRETDGVLGIWLRRELDADLPVWPNFDRTLETDNSLVPRTGKIMPVPGARETAVGVRESFSFSGLWTLCLFDGPNLHEVQSSAERRRRIFDSLVRNVSTPEPDNGPQTFFPVFDANEAGDSMDAVIRELRDHYPALSFETWFADNREQGFLSVHKGVV